jgi:hypothetical protein
MRRAARSPNPVALTPSAPLCQANFAISSLLLLLLVPLLVITNRQVVETSLLPAYIDKSTEISLSENNAQMGNKPALVREQFFACTRRLRIYLKNVSLLHTFFHSQF